MKREVKGEGEGKEKYFHFSPPLPTYFSQTNMAANSKMAANLRSLRPMVISPPVISPLTKVTSLHTRVTSFDTEVTSPHYII